MDGIDRLLNDTENFVFDMQTGGGAIIRGAHGNHVEVDKEQAVKLFVKPKGYNELLQAVANYAKTSINGYGEIHHPAAVKFAVNSIKEHFVYAEGKLDFSDTVKTKIEEAGNIYLYTDKGKAIFNFLQKMGDILATDYKKMGLGVRDGKTLDTDKIMRLFEDNLRSIDVTTKELAIETGGSNSINPRFRGDSEL